MRYRVINSRYDTQAESHEFEADSDGQAKKIFEKDYVNNSNYAWDYLDLHRVDVIEKVTKLGFKNDKKAVYY